MLTYIYSPVHNDTQYSTRFVWHGRKRNAVYLQQKTAETLK